MDRMFCKYFLVFIMFSLLSCADTLSDAVQEGNMIKVQTLLNEGAEVEARDDDHFTALHVASQFGYPAVIEVLLANGAEVNATWNAQTSGTSNVLRSIDFINDTKPLFSGIVFFTLITLSTGLAQVPGKEKIS
jgi:ankyrin repeat protein